MNLVQKTRLEAGFLQAYVDVKSYPRGVGKIAQNGRNELFSSEGGEKPPDGVRLYAERFVSFVVCQH